MILAKKVTDFCSTRYVAMKLGVQISLIALLFGCSVSKEVEPSVNPDGWRRMNNGLYLNSDGQLGFATDPDLANVPRSELIGEQCANVFLTTIGSDGKRSLNDVLDTSTFISLGGSFFKDKNHIYNFYAMCEGGYLTIFSKDTSNFRILGSCYASHHSTIYHHRDGRMDADFESFAASTKFGCIAKDKNGYFRYHERVSKEELREELGSKSFSELEIELKP